MAGRSTSADLDTMVVIDLPSADRRAWSRWVEVVVFVAIWIALGFAFERSTDAYLLLGVPLTVGFQRLVRRRPLTELWVRDPGRSVGVVRWRVGAPVVVALAVWPLIAGVAAVRASEWVLVGWLAAAAFGALAAGYAVGRLDRRALAVSWRSAAGAVLVGAVLFIVAIAPRLLQASWPLPLTRMATVAVQSLLLYLPVAFVLEEVTFRGMIDAHVHPRAAGRTEGTGWPSAVGVSMLWPCGTCP